MAGPFMGGGYIGIGKQTAFDTAVAPTIFTPFDGESFNPQLQVTQKGDGIHQGTSYSYVNGYQTTVGQSGVPLTAGAGGNIMWLGIGGTDTVTGAVDPYTHVPVMKNDLPWFTVERFFADQNYGQRIANCKLETWTIAGKMADWCSLSWQAVGGNAPKQASAASITFDADTYKPMQFRDLQLTLNGVSSFDTCAGFSIALKRNVQVIKTNRVDPNYQVPRKRTIQVSIDLLWETTNAPTWYQDVILNGGTTVPTKVPYSGSATFLIDPGASPDHQISIVIPDFRQITAVPKMNPTNLDVQMVTLTGFAQIPSGGGDEVTWSFKNATAGPWG